MQTTQTTLTPKTKSAVLTQPFKKQNSTLNKNSPSPFFAQTQTQKLKTVEQKQKPYPYLPPFIEKSIQQGAPQNLSDTAQVANTQATQTKESWWAKNHVSERIVGGLKVAAGTAEASAGAALGVASSWTGIGAVVGGAVFVHGSDVAASGLRQIYSGKQESSLTSLGLQKAGVSEAVAENMDASLSLVGSLGATAIQNKIAQKTFTQSISKSTQNAITTNSEEITLIKTEANAAEQVSKTAAVENIKQEVKFSQIQLQKKFPRHAKAFGIDANYSLKNSKLFEEAILEHINNPNTQKIIGTYHKEAAIHYFDAFSKKNVILHADGSFWSCWKLSDAKITHLLNHGGI